MFTNNYINFQIMRFKSSNYTSYNSGFVDAAGSSFTAYMGVAFAGDLGGWMTKGKCGQVVASNSYTMSATAGSSGLYFGTGSTPAKKSDYKLESPITSGLTITNPSALAWTEDGNGKYTASADFVVRNTTEAEINIYEIGLFTPLSAENKYTINISITWRHVLMERTVLTEPITIPAGGTKLVTYKITFNQTLNVE